MAVKNPTVTKMEDIQTLLKDPVADAVDADAAAKDPVDNGADNTTSAAAIVTGMRENAERIGAAYAVHRIGGGTAKKFAKTLSDTDRAMFKAMRIADLVERFIAEEKESGKPGAAAFNKIVQDVQAKGKTNKGKKKEKKLTKKSSSFLAMLSGELRRATGFSLN